MADLYIRTQDKKRLYALGNGFNDIRVAETLVNPRKLGRIETRTRYVVQISDGIPEEIGEYASIERCLEVLDNIQRELESIKNSGNTPVVFMMPED